MSVGLNVRQERFCQEYVLGGDATAAAIRADYSRWHAGMYGQVLLAMPRILGRIAELRGAPNVQANGDAPSLAALAELARAWQSTPAAPPPHIGSPSTLEDLEQLRQSMMAARSAPPRPAPPRPAPPPRTAARPADTTGDNAPDTAKEHIKDFINRYSSGRDADEPERQGNGKKRSDGPRVAQRAAGAAARRGAAS